MNKKELERKIPIGVIGPSEPSPVIYESAREVGRLLALEGFVVVTGGLKGVMEAASRGAKEASGLTVGILPGLNPAEANPYVDIPIPTGIGEMRNVIVARTSSALIAVGESLGTFTEIAFALRFGKHIVGLFVPEAFLLPIERASSPSEAVEKIKMNPKSWGKKEG